MEGNGNPGLTAFIFPGQGSQYSGMGKDFAREFPVAKQTFEEASDYLHLNFSRLCFEGSESELAQTANTQPAVLLVSVAALRVLETTVEISPCFSAGHSLGEYTACVAAKALSFTDALSAVRKRGTFMQEAVPDGEGAMAAVLGLDAETVQEICEEAAAGEVLRPANFNAPGQIVISGRAEAVDRAMELIKERRGKARRLKVSAPFHCELMEPAAERMADVLAAINFSEPVFPVISNVDAAPYPSVESIPDILTRQITSPVRWQESVTLMVEEGVDTFIEIGPGKVLSGLVQRIAPGKRIFSLADTGGLEKIEKEL